ncbi:MAG TPA: class F sortase, partial [Actinomycetales bacterium]
GAPPAGRTAVDTAVDTAVPAPAGPGPARERVTAPGDQPVDVRIPQIGVDSPLVRLGASAQGEMQVPTDFDRAGWFTGGAAPGERGPAVLAGHVDSRTGPAVFYRLAELRAGDRIEVEQRDGDVVRFTVSRVERYAKAAFPTARVYGPVPGPVLRLITCGGVFDRATGHYRDNVVVYANPV